MVFNSVFETGRHFAFFNAHPVLYSAAQSLSSTSMLAVKAESSGTGSYLPGVCLLKRLFFFPHELRTAYSGFLNYQL